jgi:purine nucleosidase
MALRRVIVDTDCGVDDAVALMLALVEPGIDVAAVTTVCGNCPESNVWQNVSMVLEAMGSTALLFRGASQPLLGQPQSLAGLMGEDGLGNASHHLPVPRYPVQSQPAALALIDLAKNLPPDSDLTLITLGPLTNLALAIRLDPQFPARIPLLMVMGGTLEAKGNTTPGAEFNIHADPEAAAIVMQAGFKDLRILPWETSLTYTLTWDEYTQLASLPTVHSKFFSTVTQHMACHIKDILHFPGMPLPDMLAMAAALRPEIILQEHFRPVDVETCGRLGRGWMSVSWLDDGQPANAHLVAQLDIHLVKSMLNTCLAG